MKLSINGQEHTGPLQETQLGPLVVRLESEHHPQGLHLRLIRVDGQEVNPDKPDVKSRELAEIESLDIEFAPLTSLIDHNLKNADSYLDKLIPGFLQAANLFRTGNEQEANQFFLNIIDGMEWFSQVVDMVLQAKNIDPATLRQGDQTIADMKSRLLELTTQMVEANKNRDWVLVADLLEYELHPFYESWKQFLPDLKSAPTNLTN